MFIKIANLVARLRARAERNRLDRDPFANDPDADAFMACVDGQPLTVRQYNALLAAEMAEFNAEDRAARRTALDRHRRTPSFVEGPGQKGVMPWDNH